MNSKTFLCKILRGNFMPDGFTKIPECLFPDRRAPDVLAGALKALHEKTLWPTLFFMIFNQGIRGGQ